MSFATPTAGYGHNPADFAGGWTSFTVTVSNPEGTTVRFTATDANNMLVTSKAVRMILADAIDQFISNNRSTLNTNGDSEVKGSDDYPGSGDGFKNWSWNLVGKYAEYELTATTNLTLSGTLTVTVPYGDVV